MSLNSTKQNTETTTINQETTSEITYEDVKDIINKPNCLETEPKTKYKQMSMVEFLEEEIWK